MVALAARVLPFMIGLMLGWLLVAPPAWFAGMGPVRHLLTAILFLFFLLAFGVSLALGGLPRRLRLRRADDQTLPETERGLVERLEHLGFVGEDALYRLGSVPSMLLLPLIHRQEQAYAFVWGRRRARIQVTFVTRFDRVAGELATTSARSTAVLPAAPGQLLQVLPGEAPEVLWKAHRQALRALERGGVAFRVLTGSALTADLKERNAERRSAFLAAPLRHTLAMYWRVLTRRSPHLGTLDEQGMGRRLERLQHRQHLQG